LYPDKWILVASWEYTFRKEIPTKNEVTVSE
jgi:hypothetical protein